MRERWARFRQSPFFPATVLVFILATVAALFAGSYTYVLANPAPHRIPVAVTAHPAGPVDAFLAALDQRLDSSLQPLPYGGYGQAVEAVEEQRVFAIFRARGTSRIDLDISSASGSSVAEVLEAEAVELGRESGTDVRVRDLSPLDPGDPRGLALFYISIAAVIIGFLGAVHLGAHADELNPAERIAFTAAYAVLGGFTITATVDWILDAVDLPFAPSWGILALTMFAAGMVFTMFNALVGRWAILPTWGLMILIGNPSSGGAVSWPLLPSVYGDVGRWLPPGASVNAQHTAVYFPGHPHLQPYLALVGWALLSSTVFWIWRERHPGGRP